MVIEQNRSNVDVNELYKAQDPRLIEPQLFPEIKVVRDNYLLAIQKTAITAYLDIQELTGGIPVDGKLDKEENKRRVKILDPNAERTYRESVSAFPFRSFCLDAEGAKEAHPDKVGIAMPTTLGWYGNGDRLVFSVSDVIEGTGLATHGHPNAISIVGITTYGGATKIPNGPDGEEIKYYRKLYAPPQFEDDVTLEKTAKQNLESVAKRAGIKPGMITVASMDRPANGTIIREAREFGAQVYVFDKGDLALGIGAMLSNPESPLIVLGRGGAPEGSISQMAARGLDGVGQVRAMHDEDATSENTPIWTAKDYVPGLKEHSMIIFSAITDNTNFSLKGVQPVPGIDHKFYVQSAIVDQNGLHSFTQIVEHKRAA